MKSDFYFTLQKLFSFSRYLNFCLDFLVTYKNGLIRKLRLISKFMTSQPGKQTIAIHVLHNISRSRDYQRVKFGHFVEYNMTNTSLYHKIWYRNYSQILFSKNQNLVYLWINSLKFYTFFYCMPSWGLSKYIETKLQTTCFYLM